jgi:hypothetical protein
MNSEIVKSGMMVLTGKEKAHIADADVAVSWMLHPAAGAVLDERERENWRDVDESEIQPDTHCNQPNSYIMNM